MTKTLPPEWVSGDTNALNVREDLGIRCPVSNLTIYRGPRRKATGKPRSKKLYCRWLPPESEDHRPNQGRNATTNSGGGDGSAGRSDITPLRTYYFSDIFPTEISEIGLSYDTTDTIEEFSVTFQVQYWVAGTNSTNGGPSDQRNLVTR